MLLQVEVDGAVEPHLSHLGLLHAVELPVTDLVVVGGEADQVEGAAVEGQPVGVDGVGRRFGRAERLVGEEDLAMVVDAQVELLDDGSLARVVALAEARAVEGLAESVDVCQGRVGERRAGLLEGRLGGRPERRASQRFQKASGDVKGDGLVKRETQRRLPTLRINPPTFKPVGNHGFFQGEPGGLEHVEISPDRFEADLQLLGQFLDRRPISLCGYSLQNNPLAGEWGFVSHGGFNRQELSG